MLVLNDRAPLAEGYMRRIYAHPERDDALIKVIRADTLQERFGGTRNWLKRRARVRQYTVFLREIREYLALRAHEPVQAPIARILGLVETDLGLGQMVERMKGPDGGLAPTLIQLFTGHGDAPWLREGVEDLFAALLEHHVVISDVNPGNIVYGRGCDDAPRFALIDGFGDKNLVPLCSISRRYNAYHTRRLREKLMRRIAKVLRGEPLWTT